MDEIDLEDFYFRLKSYYEQSDRILLDNKVIEDFCCYGYDDDEPFVIYLSDNERYVITKKGLETSRFEDNKWIVTVDIKPNILDVAEGSKLVWIEFQEKIYNTMVLH